LNIDLVGVDVDEVLDGVDLDEDEDELSLYFEFCFIQGRTAPGRYQPDHFEQSDSAHDATPNCFLFPLLKHFITETVYMYIKAVYYLHCTEQGAS